MEYRRDLRFESNQPVQITDLEDRKNSFPGILANFSANGACLILTRKFNPGAIIKVEWGRTVLLGEVIYCRPDGTDFAVGMELEDALYDKEAFSLLGSTQAEMAASTNRS